jgi:hypothetical protein
VSVGAGAVVIGAGAAVLGAWEAVVVGVTAGAWAGGGGGGGGGLDVKFPGVSHAFMTSVRNEAVVGVVGSRVVFFGVEATLMDNMGELDGGGLASVRRIFFT